MDVGPILATLSAKSLAGDEMTVAYQTGETTKMTYSK